MKIENEKKVKKSFRIESEILEEIEKFLTKSNYSFSEFINSALYHFLEKKSFLKYSVDEFKFGNQKAKNLRVNFSDDEYQILLKLAKKNGFNSVSKEVKFITLNAIYKNQNFFNNIEMKDLKNAIGSINKLGSNLNQIVKILNQKDYRNFSFNYKTFEPHLQSIDENIGYIKELIFYYNTILQTKSLNA